MYNYLYQFSWFGECFYDLTHGGHCMVLSASQSDFTYLNFLNFTYSVVEGLLQKQKLKI